jgi:hypothetical protein
MKELPSDCRIPVKRKENLLRENGLPISLASSLALRRQDVHRSGGEFGSKTARKMRIRQTRIQRRLEMAFVLILRELGSFLIGSLCRLEMHQQVILEGYFA